MGASCRSRLRSHHSRTCSAPERCHRLLQAARIGSGDRIEVLAVRTPPRQRQFSNRRLHRSRSRWQRDERAGWCSDQEAFPDQNVESFAAMRLFQIPETARSRETLIDELLFTTRVE